MSNNTGRQNGLKWMKWKRKKKQQQQQQPKLNKTKNRPYVLDHFDDVSDACRVGVVLRYQCLAFEPKA
jgi:hypothetical protein